MVGYIRIRLGQLGLASSAFAGELRGRVPILALAMAADIHVHNTKVASHLVRHSLQLTRHRVSHTTISGVEPNISVRRRDGSKIGASASAATPLHLEIAIVTAVTKPTAITVIIGVNSGCGSDIGTSTIIITGIGSAAGCGGTDRKEGGWRRAGNHRNGRWRRTW